MPVETVMALVEQGHVREAARRILEENPFPGVCGRVCFHPCEQACNREGFDRSPAIQLIERFVADETAEMDLVSAAATGDGGRVAVVGGGPAGMSAAFFLSRLGHEVTIFEAEKDLGGILRFGIPSYRLPEQVLDREVERILKMGVRTKLGVRIGGGGLPWRELERFDACFLAPGLGKPRALKIPGEDAGNVMKGLEFLRRFKRGAQGTPGRRAVVVGGGNTAIDAARTAVRCGYEGVDLFYRRGRQEMPALAGEVEEALREGVRMHFFTLPTRLFSDQQGCVVAVEIVKMQPGPPDRNGRRPPVPLPGSETLVEGDMVVVAVGEEVDDSSVPENVDLIVEDAGYPRVSGTGSVPILAGGDLAGASRTVVAAVASGKAAALSIDSGLRGRPLAWEEIRVAGGGPSFSRYLGGAEKGRNEEIGLDRMNTDYFQRRERAGTPRLPLPERAGNFHEVNQGLSPDAVRLEAGRCLHCGICSGCNNCFVFCPDIAVLREPGGTFRIQYDYCKGCGICVAECPHGAMEMEMEEET